MFSAVPPAEIVQSKACDPVRLVYPRSLGTRKHIFGRLLMPWYCVDHGWLLGVLWPDKQATEIMDPMSIPYDRACFKNAERTLLYGYIPGYTKSSSHITRGLSMTDDEGAAILLGHLLHAAMISVCSNEYCPLRKVPLTTLHMAAYLPRISGHCSTF